MSSVQKIIETSNYFSALKEELSGCKAPLFVYTESFKKRDQFKKIQNISHESFSDFSYNPDYESIVNGAEVFKKNNCDGLVSIGGGSSIDVAKGIKHILNKKDLMHISIPTTSGTGSESTQFAVVYKNGIKTSLDSKELLPDIAILDGSLTRTLPDFQKRCTLLDALCQCIESHWSLASTSESRMYSSMGLKFILSNYKQYLENNLDVYQDIMLGSNFSGRAINITRTTVSHALSYVITKDYGVPHGCAVALTIIPFWKYLSSNISNTTHAGGESFMMERLTELSNAFGGETISEGIDFADNTISEILPVTGVQDLDIENVLSHVDINRLKNYPMHLEINDIKKISLDLISPRNQK